MDQKEDPPSADDTLSPLRKALRQPVPDDLLTAATKLKEARQRFENAQSSFAVFGDAKAIRETKHAIAAAERALDNLERMRGEAYVDGAALKLEIGLAEKALAEAKAEDTLRADRAQKKAAVIVRSRRALTDCLGHYREELDNWLRPVLKVADEQATAAYALLAQAHAFKARVSLPYDTRPLRLARRIIGSGDYEPAGPKTPEWLGSAAEEWQHAYRALIAR